MLRNPDINKSALELALEAGQRVERQLAEINHGAGLYGDFGCSRLVLASALEDTTPSKSDVDKLRIQFAKEENDRKVEELRRELDQKLQSSMSAKIEHPLAAVDDVAMPAAGAVAVPAVVVPVSTPLVSEPVPTPSVLPSGRPVKRIIEVVSDDDDDKDDDLTMSEPLQVPALVPVALASLPAPAPPSAPVAAVSIPKSKPNLDKATAKKVDKVVAMCKQMLSQAVKCRAANQPPPLSLKYNGLRKNIPDSFLANFPGDTLIGLPGHVVAIRDFATLCKRDAQATIIASAADPLVKEMIAKFDETDSESSDSAAPASSSSSSVASGSDSNDKDDVNPSPKKKARHGDKHKSKSSSSSSKPKSKSKSKHEGKEVTPEQLTASIEIVADFLAKKGSDIVHELLRVDMIGTVGSDAQTSVDFWKGIGGDFAFTAEGQELLNKLGRRVVQFHAMSQSLKKRKRDTAETIVSASVAVPTAIPAAASAGSNSQPIAPAPAAVAAAFSSS